MRPLDDDNALAVAERYTDFARQEARGNSPQYESWCAGIAGDEELCRLIATLPVAKQQPNLVLAATRYLAVPDGDAAYFRSWLLEHWPSVADVVLSHATQTNEPGRTAALLTALATIDGPIALIEVGASAGLCLYPDRYSHVYDDQHRIDPADGPSAVVTRCATSGGVPLPTRMPQVVSRTGVDLHPLDVWNPEHVRWLHALIWPGQGERDARLDAAIGIAQQHPPFIVQGDLNARLRELVADVPHGVTPVVQHTAVLAYLDVAGRESFADQITELGCRWLSYEGRGVFPHIDEKVPGGVSHDENRFILALDGHPIAYAAPHGQQLDWL